MLPQQQQLLPPPPTPSSWSRVHKLPASPHARARNHSSNSHQQQPPLHYASHAHQQQQPLLPTTTQDWCYLVFLFCLVGCLAAGICTLALLDKTKAYVGGIFLFMFCGFFLCAFRDCCYRCCCCYSSYWDPYAPYMWGAPFFYYWGFGPPPVIIETGGFGATNEADADDDVAVL